MELGGANRRHGMSAMPNQAHLILLAVLVCVFSGCDPAVQARAQPTSVDEVFGAFSHISGIDSQVYELPAVPPAVGAVLPESRPCRPPGQLMKPTPMVALRDTWTIPRKLEPTALVAWEEPPLASPPAGPGVTIAATEEPYKPGAKESLASPPYSPKLEPGRSMYRNEPAKVSAWRDDTYSWCNPDANTR